MHTALKMCLVIGLALMTNGGARADSSAQTSYNYQFSILDHTGKQLLEPGLGTVVKTGLILFVKCPACLTDGTTAYRVTVHYTDEDTNREGSSVALFERGNQQVTSFLMWTGKIKVRSLLTETIKVAGAITTPGEP